MDKDEAKQVVETLLNSISGELSKTQQYHAARAAYIAGRTGLAASWLNDLFISCCNDAKEAAINLSLK